MQVIIVVSGGGVRKVCCDDPNAAVEVLDFDEMDDTEVMENNEKRLYEVEGDESFKEVW